MNHKPFKDHAIANLNARLVALEDEDVRLYNDIAKLYDLRPGEHFSGASVDALSNIRVANQQAIDNIKQHIKELEGK